IDYAYDHRLTTAYCRKLRVELGRGAELLRAVGTAHQGQTAYSKQTEQNATQHAHFSMGQTLNVPQYSGL
ncbi:hypothetical protein A235_03706, partial [Pseudomonas syringae pv. actinidiae ICMP 19079]